MCFDTGLGNLASGAGGCGGVDCDIDCEVVLDHCTTNETTGVECSDETALFNTCVEFCNAADNGTIPRAPLDNALTGACGDLQENDAMRAACGW